MAHSLSYSTILARHIADINQSIAPSDLSVFASELLQAGLITVASYQDAIAVTGRVSHDKIASLTCEVMTSLTVETSPHLFRALVDIISKRDQLLAFILLRESEGDRYLLCK